jgi:hypothetical protein
LAIEKLLLKEITSDYIRVVKDIEYLSDEQKQIIIQKNLDYYYNNKQRIKLRTYFYFREYYRQNHMQMLERQRQYRNKNYDRIPTQPQKYCNHIVIENVKIERDKITVDLN